MTLQELYEKRGKLVAAARAATDEITNNTDDARVAELEARSDKIFAELDELDKKIKLEERTAAAERSMEERQRRQRPNGGDREVDGVDGGEGGNDEQRTAEQRRGEYRDAFFALLREGGDIGAMTPEQRALLRRAMSRTSRAPRRRAPPPPVATPSRPSWRRRSSRS